MITQNIDLLHERAGSRDVIEVHGSIRECVCLACGARYPLEEVLRMLETTAVPRCTCGQVLKPGVVMFGELLEADAIDRAFQLARETKLLLVVGSTLEVQPVAGPAVGDGDRGRRRRDRQSRPDGVRRAGDVEGRREGRGSPPGCRRAALTTPLRA